MGAEPDRSSPTEDQSHADAYADLKRRQADASATQQMFAISGIGFEFIAEVGGLAFIGWWVDRKFETSPTWTLVGLAAGFTFGLYRLVRFAKRNMK